MAIRRSCVNSLILSCVFWQFAAVSWAQNYPVKIVRYVVADSAGGFADALGRIVAAGLTEGFGQQVMVDNRPGAGSNIGAAYAAKAQPDGYLMLQISVQHTVNVTLYRNLSYDLVRDLAPVTRLGSSPAIVIAHPSLPVKSITDLVKLAKARPGAVSFASAGSGSPTFMSAELFKMATGVDMLHVPYRGGGEAITGVISGETPLYFAPFATGLPPVRAGRLRPLAVTSRQRLPLFPDLPTVAESGYPGFESGWWHGVVVPAKTPKEIIATIQGAAVAALKRTDVIKRLEDIVVTPIGSQPEEFAAFIGSEIEKWGKLIRATGLTAN